LVRLDLVAKYADVHRFVTLLNGRRLLRDVEHEQERASLNQMLGRANKAWHGVKVGQPDWRDCSHSIAFTLELPQERLLVHLFFNAYWEALDFELPSVGRGGQNAWRRWIDTFRESPDDIVPWQTAPTVPGGTYRAEARSVVVLFADLTERSRP
jgi:isoamylase